LLIALCPTFVSKVKNYLWLTAAQFSINLDELIDELIAILLEAQSDDLILRLSYFWV
jgi:hypothetical protein